MAEWSARRTPNPAVRVRVPLRALTGFVLGCPELKSLATLVHSQLAASCQLGFLILLCLLKRRGNQTKTNEKIEPLHMFQLLTLQEIDCKIRITLNIKVN